MHLALWYVVIVYHQYDVCKNYVGSVYVGGYGSLNIIIYHMIEMWIFVD